MKKTEQQLFNQFQEEFDRKRKSNIWKTLAIIHTLSWLAIGLSIWFVPYLWWMKIMLVVVAEMYLLLSSFLIIAVEDYRFLNPNSLKEGVVATMEKVSAQKLKCDQEKTDLQGNLDRKKGIGEYMIATDVIVISPDPEWHPYIVSLIKKDEESLVTLEDEIDELENKLYELKIKIQFYNQVPERNFWQYLKSMKWIKKSKNK